MLVSISAGASIFLAIGGGSGRPGCMTHPSNRRFSLLLALLSTSCALACGATIETGEAFDEDHLTHDAGPSESGGPVAHRPLGHDGGATQVSVDAGPGSSTSEGTSAANAQERDVVLPARIDASATPDGAPEITTSGGDRDAGVTVADAGHGKSEADTRTNATDHEQPDSSREDSGSPSTVRLEGVCWGEAVACPGDECSCASDDGADAGHCDQHRPCDGWGEESDCNAELGCAWELREVIDEGTGSGRSCTGTPYPCERPIGTCLDGCEQVRRETDFGSKLYCEGTPSACVSFDHADACRSQAGCVWE